MERIDVNSPDAGKLVTNARTNGTPVVLVGHLGWAQFATRWLTKVESEEKNNAAADEVKKDNPKTIDEEEVVDTSTTLTATSTELESNTTDHDEKKLASVDPDINAYETGNDAIAINAVGAAVAAGTNVNVGTGTAATQKNTITTDDMGAVVADSAANVNVEVGSDTAQSDSKGANKRQSESPLLDLSRQNYKLDVEKMLQDIGEEDVPVIRRYYNEVKPIHGHISASKFLTTCWPNSQVAPAKKQGNFYLHQWQFPLSDTAGRKLCHQNNPLPKGIMGDDLLKYWLDLPQCKHDSPLQYIFMGREDTLSKLHKDPGM